MRDTSAQLGIVYDEWQQELLRSLLAKGDDGLYAADTAVVSVCRQSGKTFAVAGVVFADSIIHPGTTSVWTAHRFKVSRESFALMLSWARRPELAPHIDYDDITTANGNECIPFRNGSRIVFAARERGAIRGFTKVRRLVIDEAQILTAAAMSDLVPTTNQATNPQIVLLGTPPKPSDPGEVFTDLRSACLSGGIEGTLYAECSAEPGCGLDDWAAVTEANPSYPSRTPKRSVLRLRKLLTDDDDYRREGLGIWPDTQASLVLPGWSAGEDQKSGPVGQVAFGLDVNPTRTWASFTVAAKSNRGGTHLEITTDEDLNLDHREGTAWVVGRAQSLHKRWGGVVAVAKGSPASSLIPDLAAAGVNVLEVSVADHAAACGQILDAATQGLLKHLGQPELDAAVAGATQKFYSGDSWLWDRRRSNVDITPIVAGTLAMWALGQTPAPTAGFVDLDDFDD